MRRLATILIILVVVTGCGRQVRLDATSEASIDATYQAMISSLDGDKKAEFLASLNKLSLPKVLRSISDPSAPKLTRQRSLEPFHGMTVDEIIARARTMPPEPSTTPK
jgi:uncharacterized protein YceK